jgi:glycerophosphoryl diester phosphodiesterase
MTSLYKASTTLVFGHRGAAALAPENTLQAMKAAKKAGAHGVEFDVVLTRDKQIAVFHDLKLEKRLQDKKGSISSMTLAELRKVDLTPYLAERRPDLKPMPAIYKQAKVPTLDELFAWYKKHPTVILNIELKSRDVSDKGLEKAVWSLIQKYGYEKRVLISSFNPFALYRFRKLAPQILRGLIYGPKTPIYIRQRWFAWLAQPDALHPDHILVDAAYMNWARKKGFAVHPWTVNDRGKMQRLKALGVGLLITDYPNRAIETLFPKAAPRSR